jgi:predicted dehydrogenase
MNKCITVAVAGFGLRARDYTNYQNEHPGSMKVVAIAEINSKRREAAKEKFNIPDANCFNSAEELLEQDKLADILFVTSQDKQHVDMAIKGLEKGYHILVEKPISPSLKECLLLQKKVEETGLSVTVCHVMRYTHFYQIIKKAISSGVIGDVKTIQAIENVGYFHQAHSFVRGNWRNSEETSPMILAKSCHDMDLISWLMDKKCTHISSFGHLSHFKESCAPKGAAKRCLDDCLVKETCPYDAEKIYVTDSITGVKNGIWKWPCSAIVQNPTVETVYEALEKGPYGRCVYHCDNDVVDHQVVIMEFEDGSTADFTMSAFTTSDGRHTKIMGTLGNIIADIDRNVVEIRPFGKEPEIIDVSLIAGDTDGHAGGDERLMESVLEHMQPSNINQEPLTSIKQSVMSHVMALAAEESRLNHGKSICLETFTNEVNNDSN